MPHGTKIATCCYCGTRATLVLRGTDRHELSCSSCGAPLHNMKMLKADTANSQSAVHRPHSPQKARLAALPGWDSKAAFSKKNKKKKRKTLAKRFFEEAFDVIEDIFD